MGLFRHPGFPSQVVVDRATEKTVTADLEELIKLREPESMRTSSVVLCEMRATTVEIRHSMLSR